MAVFVAPLVAKIVHLSKLVLANLRKHSMGGSASLVQLLLRTFWQHSGTSDLGIFGKLCASRDGASCEFRQGVGTGAYELGHK
jgi:hypothetical protein